MKIFQLIFSLSSGGAERITVDLCNELSKSNEVYLCVVLSDKFQINSFYKNQLNAKVNYINLGCSKGINLKTFFTIFKLITKLKPNVIHAHLNTLIYLFLPALYYKKNIKFIHTLHNIAEKTLGFKWQKFINKFFYQTKLIVPIAISTETKKSFCDFYNQKEIILINNGTPKPKKSKKHVGVVSEINLLKRSDKDLVCIHIARFNEQKNQKLLIQVFNRLIYEGQKVLLIIIGGGFDCIEAKNLKQKSLEGIHYLGTRENISDYLFNSDVFVLSSLWEGLPISLLEAIACEVVPVSTPAGGIPTVIKDESIGFLSNDFSEEGLYNALIKCFSKIVEFDKSSLRNLFNTEFSIEKCSKSYEEIYTNNKC